MITRTFLNQLKSLINRKPILFIIVIAFFIHIFAVFFSKGYGMHDDHFGPIEQPWQIINDIRIWEQRQEPHAHSIFYPLIHFVFFKFLYNISIKDPQEIMLFVRLSHFLYHLVGIVFLYKLLLEIFDKDTALTSIIAYILLWFVPFMNVRNLIEMVCIPPLIIGFWFMIKYSTRRSAFLMAGLFFALAFSFRYQTLLITGTIVLYLIIRKKVNYALIFLLSFLLFAILIQGSVDIFAWGYPFASFIEYIKYNLTHSYDYTTGPFYRYLLLLFGIFIPPISFFILYYFVKNFHKYELIFFPILFFFLLHSIFPNKQERFILPIIPFTFAIGLSAFIEATMKQKFWANKKNLTKFLFVWFAIINLPLLIIFTLNYSKKTRCESLYYLSKKSDIKSILIIFGKIGNFKPPEFYLNKYGTNIIQIQELDSLSRLPKSFPFPNYTIIFGGEEADSLKKYSELIIGRKFILEKTISPSIVDNILFRLNPKYNRNQTARIYRIEN